MVPPEGVPEVERVTWSGRPWRVCCDAQWARTCRVGPDYVDTSTSVGTFRVDRLGQDPSRLMGVRKKADEGLRGTLCKVVKDFMKDLTQVVVTLKK